VDAATGHAMTTEAAIVEQVETCVRHPVFRGSDAVLEKALQDLDSKAVDCQISAPTYRRLRDLILGSSHFAHAG
jgi:hypothetical protein